MAKATHASLQALHFERNAMTTKGSCSAEDLVGRFVPVSCTIEKVVWSLNESFAGEPSAETEKMWKSLIPKGRAFVQHPKLAKEIKSMSVFHELHCLHGLRQMYYKKSYLLSKHQHHESQRSPLSPPHIKIETTSSSHEHHSAPTFTPNPFIEALLSSGEEHDDPDHIQHCFEYLRQALICAADTNLEDTKEEVDEDGLLGVATKGWGSERVCRDFEAVKEWAILSDVLDLTE
ncbi:uncharacterized protein J4E84_001625 [Alternaria hordeiaustralica]|uniref:uncharacterized protein n=1 Tax=Alternaria hordeiaustralica TaxID=1187925 RepID=UPI0020C4E8CF|nr:uncharacterized protein J4E84_001625 [Alternaria hordeiaustralica]KAI4695001.1 hypothetical protein J4E84_001625 [Alternaria hordeiaustralica]